MAQRTVTKTTFSPEHVIEPIYTGGAVALSGDGSTLATTLGEDVLLTDPKTGQTLARIEGDGENVSTLCLTPTTNQLIVVSRSLSLRIFALECLSSPSSIKPRLLRTFKPHTSPVICCTADRSGTLLATGAADGIVKVWDIRGGFTTHTLHGHRGLVSALHFFETRQSTSESGLERSSSKKRKRNQDEKDPDISNKPAKYHLASGSEDGQVRVWDLQNRKCAAILDSHVSVVRALDFSDELGVLLSASRDKTVAIWDGSSWKLRNTLPILEVVESAGFLRRGTIIYTGGESGRIRFWQTNGGDEITSTEAALTGEAQNVVSILNCGALSCLVAIRQDQTLLFFSTTDIEISDLEDVGDPPRLLRRIYGTHDEVIDMAYLGPARNLMALATNLEELRIVSLNQPSEVDNESGDPYFGADAGLLQGHEDIIICVDVDWSGCWLATGAKDNTAKLWRIDADSRDFSLFATFTGHAESLGAVALPRTIPQSDSTLYKDPLSEPPLFLVTASQDKTIKRWDTKTVSHDSGKALRARYTRKAHDKDINALDINYNSTLFASASQDRTVRIWSLEDGEAIGVLKGHKRGVWSVRFAPQGMAPITGEEGRASSSRGLILTGSGDKNVKIWSLSDYSCLRTFEGHTNSVLKVVWLAHPPIKDPDDAPKPQHHPQIASAGGDGLVKVWDAQSGELQCTLDNHTDRVWALAVQPATNTLVSGGGDGCVTFWRDTTSAAVAAAAQASTARVEQDQALQNHIQARNYRKAIALALQLNHPARLLALFTAVTATVPPEPGSLSGVASVDEALRALSDRDLFALLCRVRDWNANAKTAPVAQKVLSALLRMFPASRFLKLRASGGGGVARATSVKDVLDALRVYTERHYRRMEELIDESYLVQYTLREMDELGIGNVAQVTGEQTNANHGNEMVMLNGS